MRLFLLLLLPFSSAVTTVRLATPVLLWNIILHCRLSLCHRISGVTVYSSFHEVSCAAAFCLKIHKYSCPQFPPSRTCKV
ncbi:hypothetical protein BC629DRAFT_645462 [Irpex lacteus]|nr:hypothetical protein BC629DRAFT_645462 [Irpex lacteus]